MNGLNIYTQNKLKGFKAFNFKALICSGILLFEMFCICAFLTITSFSYVRSEEMDPPEIRNSGNEITVSWEDADFPGVDSYEVQLLRQGSNGSYSNYKSSKNVNPDDGNSYDFTVDNKGYYKARVRAKDVSNNYTPWSEASLGTAAVLSEDVSHNSYNGGYYGGYNSYYYSDGSPRVTSYISGSRGGPGVPEGSSQQASGNSDVYGGPGVKGSASTTTSSVVGSAGQAGQSAFNSGISSSSSSSNSALPTSPSSFASGIAGSSGEGVGQSSSFVNSGHVLVNTYTSTGWQRDQKGKWYLYEDGTYPISSWRKIDDKFYHFDNNGYMDWNRWILEANGNWYFCTSNGTMAVGWNNINDKWYYMDPSNGIMLTKGEHIIEGKVYYIDATGARVQDAMVEGHYYGLDGVRQD